MVAVTYLTTSIFAQIAILVAACYGLYESIRNIKKSKEIGKKTGLKWIIILIISALVLVADIDLLFM